MGSGSRRRGGEGRRGGGVYRKNHCPSWQYSMHNRAMRNTPTFNINSPYVSSIRQADDPSPLDDLDISGKICNV